MQIDSISVILYKDHMADSRPRVRLVSKGPFKYCQVYELNERREYKNQIKEFLRDFIKKLNEKTGLPVFHKKQYLDGKTIHLFKRPKSMMSKKFQELSLKNTTPDEDNLMKPVYDASHDVIYENDNIVSSMRGIKMYLPSHADETTDILVYHIVLIDHEQLRGILCVNEFEKKLNEYIAKFDFDYGLVWPLVK